MSNTAEICLNCRFWVPWRTQPLTGKTKGECRCYAPENFQELAPGPQHGVVHSKWPSTFDDMFCGEFENK